MILIRRFLTVGFFNTLLGYCVIFFAMYILNWSPVMSNFVGYGLGLIISYFLNRNYTFESTKKRLPEIIVFLVCFLIAYGINISVLQIAIFIGVNSGVGQIISGVFYVFVFFFLNKYFVFKRVKNL
jgi:putative flippase GtrA